MSMDGFSTRATLAANDSDFGPYSPLYSDFTLLLQEAVFTIGPAALLLLLTPFYVVYYSRLPMATAEEPLLFAKLGTNGVLVILQVVSAILYRFPNEQTLIPISSAGLACFAAIALTVFMHFEHRHAIESSPLPSLYLFVTVLLDIAKARSYSLRSAFGLYRLASITYAIVAMKIVLLVLAELPKRYRLKKESLAPETMNGFWGRTFFIWLNSTLFLGFRNILSLRDLPSLNPAFASARLAAVFEPIWAESKPSPFRLLFATFWSVHWSFFAVVPARLLYMAFCFAEPFLLQRILQQAGLEDRDIEVERGLIGAIALVRLGVAITRLWYMHLNNRLAAKTRGVLISQILRKSMLIGQHEAKRSAASSLMSADVDSIVRTLALVHETWAGVVELPIVIYMLSTVILQAASLITFPVAIAATIAVEVGRRSKPATKVWNDYIEKRVAATSKILSQMRGIKMIAAENAVADYLQYLRRTEVGYSKNIRRLSIFTNIAQTMGYAFTPVLVLAGGLFWSGFKTGFNAINIFTTLAFIYLAARPIASILKSWSQIGGFIACFERIQAYLLLKEHVDSRLQILGPVDDKSPQPLFDMMLFPVQLLNARILTPDDRLLLLATVEFGQSTVTMIVGPTGSGKTTLIKAILGEADITSGMIFVLEAQIAYCAEEEWLCNITIRANIIGENAYEETWYNRVVAACLLRDVDEFPNGDLTLSGSRGSNLSGGQRQRVALARALYCRPQVIVLDGVLSAVDRTCASVILKQLVGPNGLLRRLGSTVIMTTHSLELLKNADKVLAVHTDGTIAVQSPEVAIKKYEGRGFLADDEENSEDLSDGGSRDDSAARHYQPPKPTQKPSPQLRQTGDVQLYRYYIKSFSARMLLVWLFIAVLVTLTETVPDVYLRLWVEHDSSNKSLFRGYALLGVLNLIAAALWTWIFFVRLVPDSAEGLHRTLLDSVKNATLSFITYTDSGALLNRFSQDMSLVLQELPMALLLFSYNLFGVLATVAIIASGAKYAATLIPFIVTLLYGLQLYYLRTSRQLRILDLESKSPIYTHLSEGSEGIQHIRAFGWEQQYLAKGLELLDRSQKPFYYMFCIQRWLSLVLDLTVSGIAIILVALAFNSGSTNQAALGLGLLKVMQIGPDLTCLVEWWASLETSLGAVSRVRSFEKETPREGYDAGSDGNLPVPDNWPHRGDVQVFNVSADYTVDGTDYRALDEISVEIAAGSKVGLVGRSGSGKSSFLLTLLNFLKFSGSITIDGIDITSIPRHILRSRITTISQELMELPSSVRDNLVPQEMMSEADRRITDETLFGVLEKVGLKGTIERRGGLGKALQDVGLSAGEQQLLALARALVHHGQTNSKIVFVDEATSYIDYDCEEKLQEVTAEAFEDCTVLTIAHRYHTLQSATNFLELSAGKLVSYE